MNYSYYTSDPLPGMPQFRTRIKMPPPAAGDAVIYYPHSLIVSSCLYVCERVTVHAQMHTSGDPLDFPNFDEYDRETWQRVLSAQHTAAITMSASAAGGGSEQTNCS
jgi:hypothetical protein